MDPTRLETTYADLRDDDLLEDKSGSRWHVSGVSEYADDSDSIVGFWLGDARTKVRAHHLTKPRTDPCTVYRIPTSAELAAKLEAESTLPVPDEPVTHDAAIAAVTEGLGGVVETDSTPAELDAAARATDDEPVVLPLFESMTDLEQRSHLYLLHGVWADDLEDRKTRADTHAKAHEQRAQGKLKSRHTPHVHSENAGTAAEAAKA